MLNLVSAVPCDAILTSGLKKAYVGELFSESRTKPDAKFCCFISNLTQVIVMAS